MLVDTPFHLLGKTYCQAFLCTTTVSLCSLSGLMRIDQVQLIHLFGGSYERAVQ